MRLRLLQKLLIALFASTALVLLLIVLLTRFSFGRGFADFLHRQELARLQAAVPELVARYEANQGWEELARDPFEFHELVRGAISPGPGAVGPDGAGQQPRRRRGAQRAEGGPGGGPHGPAPVGGLERGERGGPLRGAGMALFQRIFLLDADRQAVIGEPPPEVETALLLPLEHAGTVVGWLGAHPVAGHFEPEEMAFLQHQRNSLLAGLGLGLLVAAALAWLLSRHLGRPVSAAAEGIHALAAGNFDTRVETRGNDEIAELGRNLNRLAETLSDHESARQRWMSDIAHELRTPLAIIGGELEAMADGVRPMDAASLASVSEEVQNLNALIDDLHSLALSDSGALSYKMTELDLAALVEAEVETARGLMPGRGLEIGFEEPAGPLPVEGDEQRLRQLLRNLLENSMRYTDAPGRVEVGLERRGRHVVLQVSDSAPGVAAEECARIFERFHRVEGSRNRNSGGSGLGLAICRNIVAAHGGTIEARPDPLGGLAVTVSLPVEP